MDGKLNLFTVLSRRLDWLGQRQTVLADNIANSDTPNYRPRDLNESQFQRALRNTLPPVQPQATHAAHMGGTARQGGSARSERQDEPYETSPSGNAVILEEQLIKSSKTQSDYELVLNLYRKHMDMFRLAVRGNGS